MPNKKRIKGKMAELGFTQKDIAKELELSPATVSQKINGVRPMYLDEAKKLAEILRVKDDEFRSIFFD